MPLPHPNISAAAAARTAVDIGTAPDNNTGDPLRLAFTRSNARDSGLELAVDQAKANFDHLEAQDDLQRGRLTTLEGGFLYLNWRGDWATATAYEFTPAVRRDYFVGPDGTAYVVLQSHTSTSIAADLAAGKIGDIDSIQLRADLAGTGAGQGINMVGNAELPLATYADLRAYTGAQTRVYITGPLGSAKPNGVAGSFQHDPTDTTSADNGGTIIVGSDGRRWKRNFSGPHRVDWFLSEPLDASSAFQAVIDHVTALVTAAAPRFTRSNVILMSGRYAIPTTVTVTPFVKLVADGLTVFETAVAGVAFKFLPEAGSYASTVEVLKKQQWFRGHWLDGNKGGIVFANTLAAPGTTAIAIGSETDLGALRPNARYSSCDVAVQGYETGIKFNRFHNYIGVFDRWHIESNTTCVVFGDVGFNVVNSGENFIFNDSVIASCQTAFRWHCDGFDLNLNNCSLDYIGTIFHVSRLYKKICVIGGHIETVGADRAHDGIGGILLEDSASAADNGTRSSLHIKGTSVLTHENLPLYRGTSRMALHLDYESRRWANAGDASFAVDGDAALAEYKVTHQNKWQPPKLTRNEVRNYALLDQADGVTISGGTLPVGWSILQAGWSSLKYSSDGVHGAGSLAFIGSASPYVTITSAQKFPMNAGDLIRGTFLIKLGSATQPNILCQFIFYDANNVEITRTAESLSNTYGNLDLENGVWQWASKPRSEIAPAGASYAIFRWGVSGAATVGVETRIGLPYVVVSR